MILVKEYVEYAYEYTIHGIITEKIKRTVIIMSEVRKGIMGIVIEIRSMIMDSLLEIKSQRIKDRDLSDHLISVCCLAFYFIRPNLNIIINEIT